jgi:two-component system response regulator FlrC
MSTKSILWTTSEVSLPEKIWSRLSDQGYKVVTEVGQKDLLRKVKDLSPRLWVGEINGDDEKKIAMIRDIRAINPTLAILLISSVPSIEQAIRMIKEGATDYTSNRISTEHLWALLESLLDYAPEVKMKPQKGGQRPGVSRSPVAFDSQMRRILNLAEKISSKRATVLLEGESGTGKEVIARYIHCIGDRADKPFIAINCAALPENLLESELFGHEKGAFTGAVSRKKGKFELAQGGILLLDEISEMPVSLQAKLLRVLQEREIDRVGGLFAVPIDVRVIATTNRDLEKETEAGRFRLDLYYRLNVLPIKIPPLRKRVGDIVPLAEFFLKKHAELNGEPIKRLADEAIAFLRSLPWPGNVRELENLMERVSLLADSENVDQHDIEGLMRPVGRSQSESSGSVQVVPLKDMEKRMIFQALQDHQGNRTHASKVLGISVRTLRNKLNEYGKELGES